MSVFGVVRQRAVMRFGRLTVTGTPYIHSRLNAAIGDGGMREIIK
jgi:hypothetical protein